MNTHRGKWLAEEDGGKLRNIRTLQTTTIGRIHPNNCHKEGFIPTTVIKNVAGILVFGFQPPGHGVSVVLSHVVFGPLLSSLRK